MPTTHHLRNAGFATLRLRLLKLGARVIETVSRIRLAFAAACPEASLFRAIASYRQDPPGQQAPPNHTTSTLQRVHKSRHSPGEKDAEPPPVRRSAENKPRSVMNKTG